MNQSKHTPQEMWPRSCCAGSQAQGRLKRRKAMSSRERAPGTEQGCCRRALFGFLRCPREFCGGGEGLCLFVWFF